MAYENTQIDALLAASLSDDPSLMRELHRAFLESAGDHMRALKDATNVPEWHMAAWRFKGLCASFGVVSLAELAEQATEAPLHDPALLRKMQAALAAVAAED
jgi:HPt (histidine-containing phosphotransfer) domain-containing protein